MKTHEQNKNNKQMEIEQFDWFIKWILLCVAFDWLLKRTLDQKTSCKKFLEISWYYFDVILQNGWPIEQGLLHIRVFFGRKKMSPCFDLFIRWLIKQITNTCWNHFPTSFKNHSIRQYSRTSCKRPPKMKGLEIAHGRRLLTIVGPQGKIFKST